VKRREFVLATLGGFGIAASRAWRGFALAASTPPQKGGQVIVGLSQEPTVFNPLKPHIEVDRGVHMCIFDALWRMNAQGQFVPNLALQVPSAGNGGISPDGLEYTFHLRRGVTWHDGTSFTAADVAFTYQLIMNPKFNVASRAGYEEIASLTTPDPYTIKLRLTKPYAPMLALWGDTYVVPKHVLSQVTDMNNNAFDTQPIGTGAFQFSERVPGDHITLDANRRYHGTGPYLDRVIFKYIPDLTVLFTRFQTGDIDVTGLQGITVDHYEEAKRLHGVKLYADPTNFVEYIWFNLARPQFQDKAVREALYLAMDKQNYIQRIYYGVPPFAESYLAPSSWAFNPNLPRHAYNAEKAKVLLDEAGWKLGPDGIRQKNGVKLSFTNSTTAGNKVREQAQAFLQQSWKAIGVDMQIKDMPAAVVWGDYFFKSQFDSVTVGWNIWGEAGGDPNALSWFGSGYIPVKSGQGSNTTQYSNPQMDKLLEEGVSVVSQEKRKPIYSEVQKILREDLPVLPIFYYVNIEGTKAALQNYEQNANVVSNMWNANVWWWTK
jgi:peptide/nickel transport system substrate-binding protein